MLVVLLTAIIIEGNPHLRLQVAEAVRRMGFTLTAAYDSASPAALAEIETLAPALVIFPIHEAHAGQWQMVRTLQAISTPPRLMALSQHGISSIHQSALAEGIDHVFDPLVDVDQFLATLGTLAVSLSARHRQQPAESPTPSHAMR